jgi:hypothetical protein
VGGTGNDSDLKKKTFKEQKLSMRLQASIAPLHNELEGIAPGMRC